MPPFRHILVATDFGEPSQRAVAIAADLAKTLDAALVLVHAFEIPGSAYAGVEFASVDLISAIEDTAQKLLESELAKVRRTLPGATAVLKRGVPWREIVQAVAETHADLVVMGTHGRRGVTHALLGSVAEKLVRMSPVPVLTIRAEDGAPE